MENRGNFSRIGFILAAAGSAVGLGNLWKFPYTASENGGGLFVLVYLISIAFIAFPVLLAEITLGRHTKKNPVGAFMAIRPRSQWKWVGYVGVASGFMILSFYSVVAGTTVGYFYKAVTGSFHNITIQDASALSMNFTSDAVTQIVLTAVFILLTIYVVARGVSGGIEKFSKILMPALLVILFLLLFRSLTLKGAGVGLHKYLKPDFKAFSPKLIIEAMGQAFFSLSLGMGTMITYGSYVSKKENLPSAAGWIAACDTGIALLAGFIIFPAIFSFGLQDQSGPDMMFKVLPVLFSKMPGGVVFGPMFFLLLSIAALTSTISILEVPVAYAIDEKSWNRKKASWVIGGVAFLFAIPSALSQGAVPFLSKLPLFNISFLGLWLFIWGTLSLSIGAFFIALFVGHVWKTSNAIKEMKEGVSNVAIEVPWTILVKYVAPVVILLILISLIF